jgi:hypothetical protein
MDADDIMTPNRLKLQKEFIDKTPDCVLCGGQVSFFKNDPLIPIFPPTQHPTLTLEQFKNNHKHWMANHPTFCFKKSKILEIGNYNKNIREMTEDFELLLKILKKYGIVYNIPDIVLYYRDSPNQITKKLKCNQDYWYNIRNNLIDKIL